MSLRRVTASGINSLQGNHHYHQKTLHRSEIGRNRISKMERTDSALWRWTSKHSHNTDHKIWSLFLFWPQPLTPHDCVTQFFRKVLLHLGEVPKTKSRRIQSRECTDKWRWGETCGAVFLFAIFFRSTRQNPGKASGFHLTLYSMKLDAFNLLLAVSCPV
jgi:hypothetical protein